MNESDPRSNEHYLSSSENESSENRFKSCTGLKFFKALFSLLPKQCSLLRGSLSFTLIILILTALRNQRRRGETFIVTRK